MSSKYLQVYALKVMKKVGENVPSFYCEERDIMARTTSPWLTKLDYAFQVRLSKVNLIRCDIVLIIGFGASVSSHGVPLWR